MNIHYRTSTTDYSNGPGFIFGKILYKLINENHIFLSGQTDSILKSGVKRVSDNCDKDIEVPFSLARDGFYNKLIICKCCYLSPRGEVPSEQSKSLSTVHGFIWWIWYPLLVLSFHPQPSLKLGFCTFLVSPER